MKSVSISLFAGIVAFASAQLVSADDTAAFKEKVLYSFCGGQNCEDGANPTAALIAVNGILYGTTDWGGRYSNNACIGGCGTVFSLDPTTGTEKVLYSFCNQTNCADGANPAASLIDVKRRLYGTTLIGGANSVYNVCDTGCGTVFSVDPKTKAETVLHSFPAGVADAFGPRAGLLDVNGTLYGTTEYGGNGCHGGGCGTVFSFDPGTGAEKVLYSFCSQQDCPDGNGPFASPIVVNGVLYGTTESGGTGCGGGGCGTVFSFDPGTGTEKVLYAFCSQQNCTDGRAPLAGLIDENDALYGTTNSGGGTGCGGNGCGTVFAVDLKSGTEKVLYSFCSLANCADGAFPSAGLIDVNGTLYGTNRTGWGRRVRQLWLRHGVLARPQHRRGEGAPFLLQPAELHRRSVSLCRTDRCQWRTVRHDLRRRRLRLRDGVRTQTEALDVTIQ